MQNILALFVWKSGSDQNGELTKIDIKKKKTAQ